MQVSFTGIDYYLVAPNMSSMDKSAHELVVGINNEGKQDSLELSKLGILNKKNTLHMEVSNNSQNLTIYGEELKPNLTNASKIERLQEFVKDLIQYEKANPNKYLGSITGLADTKELMKSKSELRINKIDMFAQALASLAKKVNVRLN